MKVKNLPLLPEEDIEAMFEKSYSELIANKQPIEVRKISQNDEEITQMATLNTIFGSFAEYYRREWLTIVTPARLSVYNLPDRTNNDEERYQESGLPRLFLSVRKYFSISCKIF